MRMDTQLVRFTQWAETIVDDSSWEPDGVTLQVRFCEGGEVPVIRNARRYSPIDESATKLLSRACEMGSGLGCGWAMLQILAGVNPAPVTASHGPGIEPCRCDGDTVFDA